MIAGLLKKRKLEIIFYLISALFLLGFLYNSFNKMNDFKVTYRSAVRVLEKEEIYNLEDGHYLYKYSPFFALLFSFLGLFPFFYAKLFWIFLMGLTFFGVTKIGKYLVLKHRSPPPFFYLLSFLLVAKFILRELELGQTDFLQLFFIFLFLFFLEKNKKLLCGFFFGLSIMIKLTPLIFIPYLFYRKRFSVIFSAFFFILVFLFLPSVFFGFENNLALLKKWYQILAFSTPTLFAHDGNQSVFGLFYRFFVSTEYIVYRAYKVNLLSLNPFTVNLLIYGVILGSYIYLLFLNRLSKKVKSFLTYSKEAIEYSFLLVFLSLFSPLGWIQNFSFSILACMILVFYTLETNFKNKLINFILVLSFVLSNAINYETVGRELNLFSLYCSFITFGTILLLFALSKLRLSGEA